MSTSAELHLLIGHLAREMVRLEAEHREVAREAVATALYVAQRDAIARHYRPQIVRWVRRPRQSMEAIAS